MKLKMKIINLAFSALLGMSIRGAAQGWVTEVKLHVYDPQCVKSVIDYSSASFAGYTELGDKGSSSSFITIKGNDIKSYDFTVDVRATCFDPLNIYTFDHLSTITDKTSCIKSTFEASSGSDLDMKTLFIYFDFYPRMTISSTKSCDFVSLTATVCAKENFIWEVSNSATGTFYPILTTSATSVNFTVDQLHRPEFGPDKYGTRYIRVKDSALEGRTSQAEIVDFYPVGPELVVTPQPPTCHSTLGEPTYGSVNLEIKPSLQEIDSFVVTITPVFPTEGKIEQETIEGKSYTNSSLGVGNYTVTVQNKFKVNQYGDCISKPFPIDIQNPAPIEAVVSSSNHNNFQIKCHGQNDTIWVTPDKGVAPFTYTWDKPTIKTGTKNEVYFAIFSEGKYSVTVTDSKQCKSINYSKELEAPTALTLKLDTTAGGKNNWGVSCFNKSDGKIISTVTGGVPGYTYLWSNSFTSANLESLTAGNYTLTVKDANQCEVSKEMSIEAPPPIDFQIDQLTQLVCPGDKTTLEAKNLKNTIGGVTYLWLSGEVTSSVFYKSAGTYSLTVSDGQGCSMTKSHSFIDPTPYTVAIQPTGKPIQCNGDENGTLVAIAKDDKGNADTPTAFQWFKNGNPINGETSANLNNIGEGDYEVEIPYKTGCKAKSALFPLTDPDPVFPAITTDQLISCFNMSDASIKATATGGTGGFSYLWNTGDEGPILSGIGAGKYKITAQDANGCTGKDSLVIENPAPVVASIADSSNYAGYGITCAGKADGFLKVAGSGGAGDYKYNWDNGKITALIDKLTARNYSVTVTDKNNCSASLARTIKAPEALTLQVAASQNISCFNGTDGFITLNPSGGASGFQYSKDSINWQAGSSFTELQAANYRLFVRDLNGCYNKVNQALTQPTKLDIDFINIEPAFCSNPIGRATAIVAGGAGSYQYEWRREGQTEILDTDANLLNVPAGIYRLFIKDGNNCLADNAVPITSTDGAKTSYTSVEAKCSYSSDGSGNISIIDGDGPFTVKWPDGQNTLEVKNYKSGIYNVSITDGHGCEVVQSVTISSPDPLALRVKDKTIPTCNTFCDGQMTLEASGGVGGYIYNWNGKTEATQNSLCAKTYPVILRDANNCELLQDVVVNEPNAIQIEVANATLPTCHDGCDGKVVLNAVGGNGTFIYQWPNGSISDSQTNLCSGSYKISVTDAKGCLGEGLVYVENTPELPLDLGGGKTLCVGQSTEVNAGNNWTAYQWNSNTGISSNQQKIVISDPGQYWVAVVNDQGCVAKDTFLLETSYDLLKASFLIPAEAHVGDTVVMVDVSWPMPEKGVWSFPSQMEKILDIDDIVYGRFMEAGTYPVKLTTYLGECRAEVSKNIMIVESSFADINGRLGYQKYLKEFNLYSNPNNGTFNVDVELAEEGDITLSVWSYPVGVMLKKVNLREKSKYHSSLDLRPVQPGIYLLRLDHPEGKDYIRFIVY